MAVNKKAIENVKEKIFKAFKIIDETGQNTEYYKKKFAKMSDQEFINFFKQDFPLKFQTKIFEVDPKIHQIINLLKFLKVPITEKVTMPFLYRNKDGEGVSTQPILIVYLPLKRMKQMVQKKVGYSTNISKRDYKTGLLIDTDKNGNSTDREFESLAIQEFDYALREVMYYRADSMKAKNEFYNEINTVGMVSQKDIGVENQDSIARNLISAYLLGAHIRSNLVLEDDYLPRTLQKKNAGQSGLKRQ